MKMLPHAVAVLVFLLIASNFFTLLGEEYGLKQHDIEHVMGMSKELMDYRFTNGEEALWSNNMFGGMPGYQTSVLYPSNLLRDTDRVLKLFTTPAVGSLYMCMLGFYILMLCLRVNPWLGMIAAISFGLSSLNIIYLGSGHTSKINAIGYMAPALGALILSYRGKWILGTALFALFFGLHLASNHLQMTYYLAFMLAAVGLTEIIRLIVQKQPLIALKTTVGLAVAAVLAILPNIASIMTTHEYSKFTTRGNTELTIAPPGRENELEATDGLRDNYILEYNFGGGEQWAMIIPNAKGGASSVAITENKAALQKVPRTARENMGMFRQYWGEQGSSAGAFYFGAAMFFLFVLAMIFSKDALKWPFLALMVLAIFLSMQSMNAFNDFFIHKVPYYNKFRDSKMIQVLIQIMVPAFGVLFIDSLLKKGVDASMRKWLWVGSGAILLMMVVVMANPSITGPLLSKYDVSSIDQLLDQYKDNPQTIKAINEIETGLIDARNFVFVQDAQRSLLFMLVAAGLVVAVSFNKLKWFLFAGIFGVIAVADMWSISTRYMNEDKRTNPQTKKSEYIHYAKNDDRVVPYAPDKCDEFILNAEQINLVDFENKVTALESAMKISPTFEKMKDKSKLHYAAEFGALNLNTNFRVLLPSRGLFADANIPYFHKSIGGYHAAKLKRYQEIIDFYLADELNKIADAFSKGSFEGIDSTLRTCAVTNMLNTKYVKYSGEAPPLSNEKNAFGNAWFVSNVKMVQSANEEMLSISDVDLRNTAIVHNEFASLVKSSSGIDSSSTIEMKEYATKRISYLSKSPVEAPVVFSEIYYPAGWVCRIDGHEVPTFRANYVLRAAMVPAGEHTIEWTFEPTTYSNGVRLNWIGSISLLVLVLLVLAWTVKNNLTASNSSAQV